MWILCFAEIGCVDHLIRIKHTVQPPYASRLDNTLIEKIYEAPNKAKESIVYNLSLSNISEGLELERLVKEVQSACLKYGLIDIKWLEI